MGGACGKVTQVGGAGERGRQVREVYRREG